MLRSLTARRPIGLAALLLWSALLTGILLACATRAPRQGPAGSKAGASAGSSTAGSPSTATHTVQAGNVPSDSFPNVSPPFPELHDSAAGSSDSVSLTDPAAGDSVPLSGDSAALAAQAAHAPQTGQTDSAPVVKPPATGSRPDGIVQRPRPKDLPTHVHVLLSKSTKPLSCYSLGDMQIIAEAAAPPEAGKTGEAIRLAVLKGRFVIRRSGSGFSVEQAHKPTVTTTARKLRLISVNKYNLVDLGGSVYRGGMRIIGGPNGEISAINVLGVEDYLRGVLPYELGNVDRQALEALKAQAIVARTYAYKRMMRGGNPDFHLYSDVQDQVYKGVRGEYLLSDRAVWETRGMAVTHADTMAVCYYFSTCAGQTASKHEVWGGEPVPYLLSRPDVDETGDPYCAASRYSSWTQEWDASKLAGILRRNLRSASVTDFPSFSILKGIDVTRRASCGRIQVLRLQTDRGPILVKGDKVRWALRPAATESKILPSAWFDVELSGGKVKAQGKAFGHGVGLCQVGAIGRARAKQNYREIIEAYYYGVSIAEFK